jgi:hypothetical protein
MIFKVTIFNLLIVIISFISGCVTIPPLNTTTGKPEIVISDVSKKDVSDAIVNAMMTLDFQIVKLDDYRLVFGKKDNSTAALLLGSRYDPQPEMRYTYTLMDFANGIRVMVNIAEITNPGSAFEKSTDFSKSTKAANDAQKFLENLKINFENQKIFKDRGKIGIRLKKDVIVEVLDGSPAKVAGISVGDVILKIDGENVTGDLKTDMMRITGTPNSEVILTINRNGKELTIPVTRGNP